MTDSGLDLLVRTAARLGGAGRDALVDLLARGDLARVARAHPKQESAEVLAEARPVRAVHGGVPVALAPGAFAQATADGEAALTGFVLDAAQGAASAFDLFSGSGAFALPLAKRGCSVFAADIDKAAVANLAAAARQAGLAALHAEARNLMRRPVPAGELAGAGLAIFDPPARRGEGAGCGNCPPPGCRSSSRCRAIPAPSCATREVSSKAATG